MQKFCFDRFRGHARSSATPLYLLEVVGLSLA